MLKKINYLMIMLLSIISLTSCIKERVDVPTKPDISIPVDPNNPDNPEQSGGGSENNPDNPSNPENPNNPDNPDDIIFTAKLTVNGKAFKPEAGEEIFVIWESDNNVYKEKLKEDGTASVKNLDGDYFVHLSKMPKKYTYNPNSEEYMVSADNPNCEIKLKKIYQPRVSSNNSLYNPVFLSNEGFIRCSIPRKHKIIYYEFMPKVSGTYVFESLVDCKLDMINPIANVHIGSPEWKPDKPTQVVTDGGYELKNGFTKNFKLVFSVSDNMIGNSYTFGIRVESSNDVYPVDIDFLVLNAEDYLDVNPIVGLGQVAKELDKAKVNINTAGKRLINADGGRGNYYDVAGHRNTILDGTKFKYKEDEGIYYYYNPQTNEYITPLCCYITAPLPYYPNEILGALAYIQQNGNKALTVKDANNIYYDYSTFIEKQYASIANKDGVVYVTKELKDFLLMFSNSQRLFMDGNGFIEDQFGVMSIGADQWLFACCYYI